MKVNYLVFDGERLTLDSTELNWILNVLPDYQIKPYLIRLLRADRGKTSNGMKIMLDSGATMPTRAHLFDAGLDLYARETQIVPAKESAKFDTGVHVELPAGTVGMLKSKSGLNVKYGLTSEGVIDVGYTGSIVVKLYNNSGYDYKVNAGDKITQLVIMPILTPSLELVESLDDTERGAGGFGSTGK
jgi:dUTP pyrophosphatase